MSRSSARVLAPLALLACAAAIVVIVSLNSGGSGSTASTPAPGTAPGRSATTTAARGARRHRHTYVVKSGDVLSAIAERTGVALTDIQRLNPTVDAHSLHAGQRLKLGP